MWMSSGQNKRILIKHPGAFLWITYNKEHFSFICPATSDPEPSIMEYNKCKNCGAFNGRAGVLFSSPYEGYYDLCRNCKDTLTKQVITIHTDLHRTEAELAKTFELIERVDR